MKVYIPIPKDLKGDTCLVYRQESNNHWTALNAYREDGFLVFETDHFSLYAIVGEKQTISIATKPNKTTYLVNDVLDSTGLTLKVGDEIIDNGFICSPSVLSKNGKQTITVTYMGLTTEFTVMVEVEDKHIHSYEGYRYAEWFGEMSHLYFCDCNSGIKVVDGSHVHRYQTTYNDTYKYHLIKCSCGYQLVRLHDFNITTIEPTPTSSGFVINEGKCTCCEDYTMQELIYIRMVNN